MKIVQVVNTMITNQKKITNVIRRDKEYFFLYDGKYKWSISKSERSEDYFIHFYPTEHMNLDELSLNNDWEAFNHFVTYATIDIKAKEAQQTFAELYQVVANKVYGLDDIFDDIINSDK